MKKENKNQERARQWRCLAKKLKRKKSDNV